MNRFYIAGIVPEQEGGFSVYFPDVPNVAAGGETVEEAMENAASGLYLALRDIAESNGDVPEPSPMAKVRAAVAAERELDGLPCPDDTLYQYIEAPDLDMVPVRVNVTIPRAVLHEIDRKAKLAGYTRSGFLAAAAQAYS
jgi:predicted RNase H-like HicB family nuclease